LQQEKEPRPRSASFAALLRGNVTVLAGALVVIAIAWLGWRWLAPLLGFGR
jgi:hypothetical protein